MTIVQLIKKIINEFCYDYCKFNDHDDSDEGSYELFVNHCSDCPFKKVEKWIQ